MVKLAFPLALLAMALSVAAAPPPAVASQSRGVSNAPFSFEAWVEDMIANPGKALTVDEALAAVTAARVNGTAGGRLRRDKLGDSCYGNGGLPHKRANGRDAAACVQDLAKKGLNGVACGITEPKVSSVQFCKIGNAAIYGTRLSSDSQSANCNDIARTAGRIFDLCWWSNDSVRGRNVCLTNEMIDVTLEGVEW